MGFQEAIRNVFDNYANFNGRARRSEYWYFSLFTFLVGLVFSTLRTVAGDGVIGSILIGAYSLFSLAVLVPGLAVSWRRLHDIRKSGAYIFIALIPLVGPILLLIWFCQEGDRGPNQYGPDPKGGIGGTRYPGGAYDAGANSYDNDNWNNF